MDGRWDGEGMDIGFLLITTFGELECGSLCL